MNLKKMLSYNLYDMKKTIIGSLITYIAAVSVIILLGLITRNLGSAFSGIFTFTGFFIIWVVAASTLPTSLQVSLANSVSRKTTMISVAITTVIFCAIIAILSVSIEYVMPEIFSALYDPAKYSVRYSTITAETILKTTAEPSLLMAFLKQFFIYFIESLVICAYVTLLSRFFKQSSKVIFIVLSVIALNIVVDYSAEINKVFIKLFSVNLATPSGAMILMSIIGVISIIVFISAFRRCPYKCALYEQ